MRIALAALATSLVVATPALANEGHVDVHTGLGWTDGLPSKAVIGGSAGYDVSVGPAFVGVEESADKVLASGSEVRWGTSGRIGTHITPATKIYATAGYNYGVGPNATDVGGGVEHSFGPMYGRVEYKHYFNEDGAIDSNAATVGVGIHF